MPRRDRLVLWLAGRIPTRLLVEPERIMLAAAWILIGGDTLILGAPTSGLAGAPAVLRMEAGGAFLVGGVATLAGLWRHRVWLESLGHGFTILACVLFVYGVAVYVGPTAIPVAGLYLVVATTYGLRLLAAAALRARLRHTLDGGL